MGGYHPNEVSQEAWEGLKRALAVAAPEVHWSRLPSFRLCYDDPFSVPFGETCRSSIGYIISKNCGGKLLERHANWFVGKKSKGKSCCKTEPCFAGRGKMTVLDENTLF